MTKKIIKPEDIGKMPVTRRSLLDWFGKAVVIGLGSELIWACNSLGRDKITCSISETGEGISFVPGENGDEFYCNLKERTVDPQDLVSILSSWNLTVDGLVNSSTVLSFNDILALERYNQVADHHCVEGWSVYDIPWNGIRLSTLFDIVEPLPGATHVTFHTVNNIYNESLPIADAVNSKTMLAFGINESTIPLKHGFPLRLVVPGKWGYKSPKYVYRIELTNEPVNGFWVQRGYPYEGKVTY
ncbi:molybdopterin-dependent oxidoreductase [Spirochaetota bacterium]